MIDNPTQTALPPPSPSATQSIGEVEDLPVQQVPLSYFNNLLSPCMAAEIFNLVKEQARDEINFNNTPIPFILGSVCRSWRETVSMDSKMWDTIVIKLSRRKFDAQLNLLHDWLLRSGHWRPLYCYISLKNGKRNSIWTPPLSFARLIIGMSSRWKVFECSSSITALSRELEAEHDFSLLSKMKVYPSRKFRLDFSSATQLRDLVVAATKQPFLLRKLIINWASLTSLGIEDLVPITTAIKMVENLVGIQSLSLRLYTSASGPAPPNQVPRTLPMLTNLTLSATSPRNITAFLDAVTTPALADLCLVFSLKNGNMPVNSHWLETDPSGLFQAFPSLIHRSLFALDRFTVVYPTCWHNKVACVMIDMASLAGLSIKWIPNRESVEVDMRKQ